MQAPRVVVPIITPFDDRGRVYERGVRNLLEFLSGRGIRGVWILGSYGAFPLMETEERERMAEMAVAIARDLGLFTIVHVGSPGVAIALRLLDHAQRCGADAVAAVAPFYYASAHYREGNFLDYFRAIVNGSGVPVVFYNNPKTTGYTPPLGLVESLLELGIRGIKDTTTDFVDAADKIRLFARAGADRVYFAGSTSMLLPTHLMGAPAAVCGTAVAMPEVVLRLDAAVAAGDLDTARRLQDLVLRIRSAQGRYVGRSVACYQILAARGVDAGSPRTPWRGMTETQRAEVLAELEALGALA